MILGPETREFALEGRQTANPATIPVAATQGADLGADIKGQGNANEHADGKLCELFVHPIKSSCRVRRTAP